MIYLPKHRNNELNKSKTMVSLQISIYITSSALKGIPDISPRKPTATAANSTPAKHQISASSSCFSQLLFHSSTATAASQKLQPKQTDP